MAELFFLLMILAFAVCAVYGFFVLVHKLVTWRESRTPSSSRSLDDDIKASTFLLNHLRQQDLIDDLQYERIRSYLDANFGDKLELPRRLPQRTVLTSGDDATTGSDQASESEVVRTSADVDKPVEIVMGELVGQQIASGPFANDAILPAGESQQVHDSPPLAAKQPAAAPWDLPDPPIPQPRRRLADVLAGFMEEKNIRWGELASGILIVGSAIGLVVSLRNELNDTIPYFPALLFLLITAAIHGAGSYTLRKWKLRNTSRGTLLIGLLLIPLNILAACVLTGSDELRRPLIDPLYWVAVSTGVVVLGAMTWWSSRLLLRKRYLPITVCILGAAIMTLVINRLEFTGMTSWRALISAMAVAICAAAGVSQFMWTIRPTKTFSSRHVNRRFMLLGLSVFAFASAVSLILIRAVDKPHAVVALAPAATAVFMLIAANGANIHARARGREWKLPLPPLAAAATIHSRARGRESNTQKIVAQALMILGLILAGVSMVASASNPTILLLNGIVAAVSLWMISQREKIPALLPAVWAALAVVVISGINLIAGSFSFDGCANFESLRTAFVSGRSGLSLLALACTIAGINAFFAGKNPDIEADLDTASSDPNKQLRYNLISAAVIAGLGCLLALSAGLINRANVFDTMTASALLLFASVVLLRLNLIAKVDGLATLASLVVTVFFAFSLLWNPTTSAWIEPLCFGLKANWVYVFSGIALVVGLTAAISARPFKGGQVEPTTHELGRIAAISAALSIAVGLNFINSRTGLTTLAVLLSLIAWILIAWSHRNVRGNRVNFSIGLALNSGLLLSVFVYEFGSKIGLSGNQTAQHWLVQFIVLSVWSSVWSLSAIGFRRSRSVRWVFENQLIRGDQIVLAAVLLGTLVVIGGRLFEACGRELSDSWVSILSPIGDVTSGSTWAIVAAFVAVVASLLKRSNTLKGLALVSLYLLAWWLAAAPFDGSRSTGAATRWLLPLGAIMVAGLSFLFPWLKRAWRSARSAIGLDDHENGLSGDAVATGDNNDQQQQLLINFLLTVSVIIVLAISSLATAQVLLTEAAVKSLGGPLKPSWFGSLPAEVNYGVPGGIMTTAILLFAISQRRSWLAFAGSAVYQYVVLFSIAMLFLSVHPALATVRFIQTLQAVSIGMTGYGLIWYWQRQRIGDSASISATRNLKVRQIELHTLINCLLVTSLAVLIGMRFFAFPDQSGGWINTAGSPLGLVAMVAAFSLLYLVWRDRDGTASNAQLIPWLFCWTGLVLVSMLAAIADKWSGGGEWIGFRLILWGSILVASGLTGLAWLFARNLPKAAFHGSEVQIGISEVRRAFPSCVPVLMASSIALLFAHRGIWNDPTAFAQYLSVIGLVVVLTTVIGFVTRSSWPSFVSAVAVVLGGHAWATVDPAAQFSAGNIDSINLVVLGLVIVSLAWSGIQVWRSFSNDDLPTGFAILPNTVLLLSSAWVFVGSFLEWMVQANTRILGGNHVLAYPWGVAAVVAPSALIAVQLWCPRRRFAVIGGCLWSLGVAILSVAIIADEPVSRNVWIMFVVSMVPVFWGIVWLNRDRVFNIAGLTNVPNPDSLNNSLRIQLPIYTIIVGSLVMLAAWASILQTESRPLRFLTAMTPPALSIAIGFFSDPQRRRWMQILSLVLATIGFVFAGWADLAPQEIHTNPLRLAIRTLLVLAGAMFIYGGFVSRWVREGDNWIRTLREMTVVTCAAALLCLGAVVAMESMQFVEAVGCGVSTTESAAASAAILGMIAGLIIIAVRPRNDPFSLSLRGRMGYVYAAELAGMLLICHLYFSMPWLFQNGIKQYWPYIAMALAFGGVGMGQLLEKRNLTVLGQPIFHTAAILPVLVSVLFWTVDSKADASLVLLAAGLAYLLISYTHNSILSGAAAVVLGNLALWVFYDRFPGFSFLAHPQLWLIPPAMSVLIAGHLASNSLSKGQLATLRYLCVAVIYISSTMEIFISGIGDKLWPPMVLAVLAVIGILLGIVFQVRAYLFFGTLFLLMAMITMVSHAHQRLGHTWPWWAFGIGMGIAILVMFGWFESRKTRIKAIAGKLRQWDL